MKFNYVLAKYKHYVFFLVAYIKRIIKKISVFRNKCALYKLRKERLIKKSMKDLKTYFVPYIIKKLNTISDTILPPKVGEVLHRNFFFKYKLDLILLYVLIAFI